MPPKAIKHPVGSRFHSLTVIGYGKDKNGRTGHIVRCECGTVKTVNRAVLERSKSCGCKTKEILSEARKTHGLSGTRAYTQWRSMKARCNLPARKDYERYGGRGISYCDRWASFEKFIEDMGDCPNGYQLDRIDNDGDYCPENCRWASPRQNANNRRSNRRISFGGKTRTLIQWARELKIPRDTLAWRLDSGWPVDSAMSKPVKEQTNNRSSYD